MTREEFWRLIDRSRQEADGNIESQMEILAQLLGELPVEEIESYQHHFGELRHQAYNWDVWGAAYIIGSGCSDDGFMDFRGWLISRGKAVYENALQNPDSLADVVTEEDDDCQMGSFAYVQLNVWLEKTGRDMNDFPFAGSNLGENPSGTPWEEEDLPKRFPRLFVRFGW